MASIATCPKCRAAVGVPEGTDSLLWVRCPTCGGQFQLQAALAIVPPSLEVIARPADQQSANPATSVSTPPHAPNFPTLPEVSSHMDTHFAAIPHSAVVAERISQKQKNVLIELLKIVLGGMAGLLLGYAILFWGFRVDPFHFAKFCPAALVPQNLSQAAE